MSGKLLERVERLAAIWGPSGREQQVAAALEEMISPFVDAVRRDPFGNLLAVRKGKGGGRRVLLSAHMDTAGALALNVSERGLIYLAPVGGFKAHHAIGQRVVWGSGAAGILQSESVDEAKQLDMKKLFCDIGASGKDEVLSRVALGDICAFAAEVKAWGDLVVGPGLDNRAGCAVLLEVAERLAGSEHEVTFAFTSQGEVAPRGAGVAAYGAEPEIAFVVDGGPSGDIPGVPRGAARLGDGPALKLKDGSYIAHHGLASLIRQVAEENRIPLQVEIGSGPSEGQAVTAAGPGRPTAVIDIPVRYRGTAAEMVSLRDLQSTTDLLLKLLGSPLALA